MDLPTFLQSIANGVIFGVILALCAVGLTLVYGILNLSNFAHGDMLTFGAYMALFFGAGTFAGHQNLPWLALAAGAVCVLVPLADRFTTRRLHAAESRAAMGFGALLLLATAAMLVFAPGEKTTTWPVLAVAGLLSVLATVVLVVGFEFALWRPLRRRGATVLSLVIASLGLSLVMRNGIQQLFGGDQRTLDRPIDEASTYFGVHITGAQWVALAVSLLLIGAVHVFLAYTRTGKAMRALADNRDLARVCGIDVDRVIVYVWILGAALVAVAGILLALNQNNTITVNMGFGILIPIFAAVLLGGIGSAYGAIVGGLAVGIAMRLAPTKYDLAFAFLLIAAVLVFRPQGIFGRPA